MPPAAATKRKRTDKSMEENGEEKHLSGQCTLQALTTSMTHVIKTLLLSLLHALQMNITHLMWKTSMKMQHLKSPRPCLRPVQAQPCNARALGMVLCNSRHRE